MVRWRSDRDRGSTSLGKRRPCESWQATEKSVHTPLGSDQDSEPDEGSSLMGSQCEPDVI